MYCFVDQADIRYAGLLCLLLLQHHHVRKDDAGSLASVLDANVAAACYPLVLVHWQNAEFGQGRSK
jgi:hypothetical protein